MGPCNLIKKVTVLETQVQVQFTTLFHTCCETLHRSGGRMKVNERRTVVGGLIGHCVSPQPWREIDAQNCLIARSAKSMYVPLIVRHPIYCYSRQRDSF